MTAELPGFQQATAVRNFIEGLNVNRLSNASRVVIAVVLAIAVTSCGGGGGGGGSGGPDPGGNPPPPPPDPPTARLTVTITGQGEVLTPDQTLMCDSSCVFEVDQGANLTLNADPAADYDFNHWQGDCADSANTPTCALAIDSNKNVFAGFKLRVVENSPPQAAITGEQTSEVNSPLQLSGAQSSDPDGDPLTYQWSVLSTPTSATATFESPTDARTTFEGDLPGIYLVSLVVNDGENSSPPAMFAVGLSVPAPGNTPPVALITGDASGEVLTALQLSGAQSSDADGDSLVYQWSVQSAPALANVQFGSATQPLTTFLGDTDGLYVISLVVHDGQAPSVPATFVVSLVAPANTPPVAVITGDASGETQALLQLSGAQSSDADGDPLTYQWSVQSAPAAANAVLGSPAQAQTTIQGDVEGTYVVSLLVNDGTESSLPATFAVSLSAADNTPPVAVITGDASGETQALLQLSGEQSSDADGDPLTYQWSVQSTPAAANAVLGSPAQVQTTIQGDVEGTYVVSLLVNDGAESSLPATFAVSLSAAGNTPPVAVISGEANGTTQALLQLSGAQSMDADGDPLTYQWSVQLTPPAANAVLGSPTQAQTTFQGNAEGAYVVSLVVNDGQEDSAPSILPIDLSDQLPGSTQAGAALWPHALEPCSSPPDVYWGDFETNPVTDVLPANGIPDIVDQTGKPHYWYDPGARGLDDPSGDPQNGYGDTLRYAFSQLPADGGVIGIIGLGADTSYDFYNQCDGCQYASSQHPTELSGKVSVTKQGPIEICGVVDLVYVRNIDPVKDIKWQFYGDIPITTRNIRFDGIFPLFSTKENVPTIAFQNTQFGGVPWECPIQSTVTPSDDSAHLRVKRGPPGWSGGGVEDDPIDFFKIYYDGVSMVNCDSDHNHHNMYWSNNNCLFFADNFYGKGYSTHEAFRQLCRFTMIEGSTFQNTLNWAGAVSGGSPVDQRGNGFGLYRSNHIRVMSNSTNSGARNAITLQSRRSDTGSTMPNQFPGIDAQSDDYAGNDNYTSEPCTNPPDCQELTAAVTAPSPPTDRWLHNGKVWDRTFWQQVTSAPFRGDQRTLTMQAGHTVSQGDTVTGNSTGAAGVVWKVVGNAVDLFLTGETEFTAESLVSGGTVTAVAYPTARQFAENAHLFPTYANNNVFEARCTVTDGGCPMYPFQVRGTYPGVGVGAFSSKSRYFIVPLDTDPDLNPDDGYDTEAIAGDGWVQRSIIFSINNDFIGDWTDGDLLQDAEVMTWNDGTYNVTVYEAQTRGPNPDEGTAEGALTPTHPMSKGFVIDLGGSVDDPLPLPDWWPQGDRSTVCNTMADRYGDDPNDPDDYFWYDEPSEISSLGINSGFPRAACP